ncbi:hypothetical protein C8R43DRAFT_1026559 [Mycena crocata]|nr:hypothetical protein C8R43DRAFT_1026559 [Mycena crocata]
MRPLFTRVYSDDTLILTTIVDRHTRHAAFEHVLEELYLELTGDLGRYKLGGLGYSATSRVAADCLIPFLADILQRFAHAADLKDRRNAITADKLVEVACYSISLDTEAASTVPAKPVPYSERIVLPPVIIPIARHGPKIKTRGNTTLIELPAPVPAADDIPPKLYEVPGTIYAILERIFLPKFKGRVTFKDLQRVCARSFSILNTRCVDASVGHDMQSNRVLV